MLRTLRLRTVSYRFKPDIAQQGSSQASCQKKKSRKLYSTRVTLTICKRNRRKSSKARLLTLHQDLNLVLQVFQFAIWAHLLAKHPQWLITRTLCNLTCKHADIRPPKIKRRNCNSSSTSALRVSWRKNTTGKLVFSIVVSTWRHRKTHLTFFWTVWPPFPTQLRIRNHPYFNLYLKTMTQPWSKCNLNTKYWADLPQTHKV